MSKQKVSFVRPDKVREILLNPLSATATMLMVILLKQDIIYLHL